MSGAAPALGVSRLRGSHDLRQVRLHEVRGVCHLRARAHGLMAARRGKARIKEACRRTARPSRGLPGLEGTCEMSDPKTHYDELLAQYYTWMFGVSFAEKVAEQHAPLQRILGPAPRVRRYARRRARSGMRSRLPVPGAGRPRLRPRSSPWIPARRCWRNCAVTPAAGRSWATRQTCCRSLPTRTQARQRSLPAWATRSLILPIRNPCAACSRGLRPRWRRAGG